MLSKKCFVKIIGAIKKEDKRIQYTIEHPNDEDWEFIESLCDALSEEVDANAYSVLLDWIFFKDYGEKETAAPLCFVTINGAEEVQNPKTAEELYDLLIKIMQPNIDWRFIE